MSIHNTRSVRSRLARKLVTYASAAGAAALPSTLEAAIVYTDLGPQGVVIPSGSFNMDLNLDGLIDFMFVEQRTTWFSHVCNYSVTPSGGSTSICFTNPVRYERILRLVAHGENGVNADGDLAAKLHSGESISIGADVQSDVVLRSDGWSSICNSFDPCSRWTWSGGHFGSGYLGLKFEIADVEHTAWARMEVVHGGVAELFGYAYETVPGKAIAAGAVPEPPSLVLLAAGAAGLTLLRRRRDALMSPVP